MILYKYCGPGGLLALDSKRMWLTRPRAFNDPFDVLPSITRYRDSIQLGEHVFAKTKDIVVLSLTENDDSLLMWGHYADQHRGLLIGFDGAGRIVDDGLLFRRFGAISYSHHRPSADRFKHLSDDELYFRKSSEWAYEREWRVVSSILGASADGGPPVQVKEDQWSFPIETTDVRCVVVGHRAFDMFPKIYEVLGRPEYAKVVLKMAVPDAKQFRLRITNWPRSKWGVSAPLPLLKHRQEEMKAADK